MTQFPAVHPQDVLGRLSRMERMLMVLLHRSGVELDLETQMAINFDNLAASLEKLRGAEASTNKLVTTMQAKLDELSASITNPEDQAKVEAFAASFAEEADKLPAAVAANPAPADQGGSTG